MRAINDKVTQEQLRLAAENRLQTVEAEQKQKVAIAEAEANAVKAKADGTPMQSRRDRPGRCIEGAERGPVAEQGRAGAAQDRGGADQGGPLERPLPQNVYAGTPILFFQPH